LSNRTSSPSATAKEIRRALERGGSREHAKGVQWFFKEEVKSHGWYSAALRREAVRQRKLILHRHGPDFLLEVANRLFAGEILEEKNFAVFLLEKLPGKFGDAEFKRLASWLPRISSWADHDALVYYLIGPMMVTKPSRIKSVFHWAKSKDRRHRRAACVALIPGTRRKMFFPEIVRLSNFLLHDSDDMAQKGLGWLLRETAKANAKRAVPYLMKIRHQAPRLVLRTACETSPLKTRTKVLS
jgi:3-methyladenine DNA glycosylase AlkD